MGGLRDVSGSGSQYVRPQQHTELVGNLGERVESFTDDNAIARSEASAALTQAAGTVEELTEYLAQADAW